MSEVPKSPDVLEAEAASLEAEATAAEWRPGQLRLEAARCLTLAAALRQRDARQDALAAAKADAGRAVAEYEATGPAEAEAAARAVEARHLFEAARDQDAEAIEARRPPAVLLETGMRAEQAALVDQHELEALAAVRQARQSAYEARDAARDRVRSAKAALAAAEAAVSDPAAAELDHDTLTRTLMLSWPARLLTDLSGRAEHKLSKAERDACVMWAVFFAELAGVGPQSAAAAARDETRRVINSELARTLITLPGGREVSISGVVGRL